MVIKSQAGLAVLECSQAALEGSCTLLYELDNL